MANDANVGSFVPTNFVWDVAQIYSVNVNSDEFKELLVRLYQNINLIQMSLNTRDAGHYDTSEFVNGQLFFPNPSRNSKTEAPVRRQVYRKIVNFGALPNTATKSVAHNLTVTSGYTFTRLYGAASDTVNKRYIAIPNANTDVNLEVDATNVKITTSGNLTNFTTTYVILEYIKQ